jgi:hypothetical protein
LADLALLRLGPLAAFTDQGAVAASIMEDAIAWRSPHFWNVRASISIKGIGKKLIDSALSRSRSFDILLKGKEIVSSEGAANAVRTVSGRPPMTTLGFAVNSANLA